MPSVMNGEINEFIDELAQREESDRLAMLGFEDGVSPER